MCKDVLDYKGEGLVEHTDVRRHKTTQIMGLPCNYPLLLPVLVGVWQQCSDSASVVPCRVLSPDTSFTSHAAEFRVILRNTMKKKRMATMKRNTWKKRRDEAISTASVLPVPHHLMLFLMAMP